MATQKQEYLKNKDGEIFSPITSTDSIYFSQEAAGGEGNTLTDYLTPKEYKGFKYGTILNSTKGAVKVYTYGKLVQVHFIDCYLLNPINISASGGWIPQTTETRLITNLPVCMNSTWSVNAPIYIDNWTYNQFLVCSVYSSEINIHVRGIGRTDVSIPVSRFNSTVTYIAK